MLTGKNKVIIIFFLCVCEMPLDWAYSEVCGILLPYEQGDVTSTFIAVIKFWKIIGYFLKQQH